MNENKNTLTSKDEARAARIAKIAAALPEREQDQLFYMIQGYLTFKSIEQRAQAQSPASGALSRAAAL